MGRDQPAYRNRCWLVTNSPRGSTVNGCSQGKCKLRILVGRRRTRHHDNRSVQRGIHRKHNDRPPFPEFRKLRILGKIAPVELSDLGRRLYAGCNPRGRVICICHPAFWQEILHCRNGRFRTSATPTGGVWRAATVYSGPPLGGLARANSCVFLAFQPHERIPAGT
jgi:hypothetical protein